MNYAQPTIDHDKIQYHARELPKALEDARVNCELCAGILEELADNHCTGSEHWRDAHDDRKKPKLYIIHPLNSVCPIHGRPEPGKRIRTYIGADPAKIEEAQQAITRYRHYKNAFHELQALHRRIKQAHANIRQTWYELGLKPPDPDDIQTLADSIEE